MVDMETIKELFGDIKLILHGGFVKLQHELELIIISIDKFIFVRNMLVILETLRINMLVSLIK